MVSKTLFERAFAELPNLTPENTRNSTPGRERKIELRDSEGIIDTIDVTQGDEQKWVGFNYGDRVVTSIVDVTPAETMQQELKDDEDLRAQEGLAARLSSIEERLTLLENNG